MSVPVLTSSLSLGLNPTMAAYLSMNNVLFVCESSFIVSGVLPVTSFPLPIGENPLFVSCSSAFGVDVDSVVFSATSSILCSGVSSSISVIGALFRLVIFPSVVCSLSFRELTMLTEIFFFFILGLVVSVCLCWLGGQFYFCPTPLFSGNDTLVLFMFFICSFVLGTILSIYWC